jgi:hypothetical protein
MNKTFFIFLLSPFVCPGRQNSKKMKNLLFPIPGEFVISQFNGRSPGSTSSYSAPSQNNNQWLLHFVHLTVAGTAQAYLDSLLCFSTPYIDDSSLLYHEKNMFWQFLF